MSKLFNMVDLRAQVIDNACVLFPQVPINNFRIITRETQIRGGYHYDAYLIDIELSDEDRRRLNRVLVSTEGSSQVLDVPATAYAALLLKTSLYIDRWIRQNPSAME